MLSSARNQIAATVIAVEAGAVNSQIALSTSGGERLTAVVTRDSVSYLGLVPGQLVTALIKAPWVMLVATQADARYSARNQLNGLVTAIVGGAVNSSVTLKTAAGTELVAVVTNSAVSDMALGVGSAVTALFKASHIVLAVG